VPIASESRVLAIAVIALLRIHRAKRLSSKR
jgi:hypothetical protein